MARRQIKSYPFSHHGENYDIAVDVLDAHHGRYELILELIAGETRHELGRRRLDPAEVGTANFNTDKWLEGKASIHRGSSAP